MPNGDVNKRKRVFLFFRLAVVAAAIIFGIVWVTVDVGWGNLARTFLGINIGVFASIVGIFVLSQVIVGLRWWLLLRSQSIFIPFFSAVKLHFLGLFYNNCMPGAVGGDLIRAWYVTKYTDKRFEAALSVFVDRAIGLLSTIIIAAFSYSFFLRGQVVIFTSEKKGSFLQSAGHYRWVFIVLILVVVGIVCGLLLVRQGRVMMKRVCAFVYEHSAQLVRKFGRAVVIYCRSPFTIFAVFALTLMLQSMVVASFWFLGRDIGITASAKYYFVFFPLTWVFGAVPVSIGGAGVVEGGLVSLFMLVAGVQKPHALAIALSQRAVWMLASLPGAVIHLTGAHLPGGPKTQ